MKKVLVAFVMILLLLSLCACSVPANSFMSRAQASSLAKKYPNPQAVLTLTYKTDGKTIEMKITYDLLLAQAPIAVTRFIQLANEGAYDGTVVDTYDSTYKYVVMGRYGKDEEDNRWYDYRSADITFAGEFEQNGYRAPRDGYAQFETYSLAMYHENSGSQFDSANGTFLLALKSDTLNSSNYAVFAHFASMTILTDGEVTTQETTSKRPQLNDKMTSLTGRTTRTVYDVDGSNSRSVQIVSSEVTLTVEISETPDGWKKLPTIR